MRPRDGALAARDQPGESAALMRTTEMGLTGTTGPNVRDKRTSRLSRMDARRDDRRKGIERSRPGSSNGDNP